MTSAQPLSRILLFAFFLGLLGLLFINIKAPFNFYDEGFAVVGAERVLNGHIPYKDFWAIYPPGQFYMLAGMFKVFGNDLLVSRVYDTLVRFAIAACVYGIVRLLTASRLAALLIAFVIAFLLAAVGFYSYAIFPALALNLAAFVCFITYLTNGQRRWLVFTGLLVGAAALVRLDLAFYATLSITASVFLLSFLRSWNLPDYLTLNLPARMSRSLAAAIKESLPVPVAVLLVALTGYSLIVLRGGWANVYDQLIVFPTTVFHEVRRLPYPPLNPLHSDPLRPWVEFYLPLLIFATAFIYFILRLFRQRQDAERAGSLAALSLAAFGSLLFAQALSRYDYIHVLPSTILALVVAILLFHHLRASRPNAFTRVGLPILLVVLLGFYLIPANRSLRSALRNYQPFGCYSDLQKAGCVVVPLEQAQTAVAIQAQTGPQNRIYSGNLRHDSIFVNDVGLYYLADRLPGTRYHELHPGVATTLPVQEEIAQNLEDSRVEWMVLVDMWQSTEPNDSRLSSNVFALDQYLRAEYEPVNQYGMYQIWRKR